MATPHTPDPQDARRAREALTRQLATTAGR